MSRRDVFNRHQSRDRSKPTALRAGFRHELTRLSRMAGAPSHKFSLGLMRWILELARPYRKLLATFLFLVVTDALITAAYPLIYRTIIDRGILRNDPALVLRLALLVGALAIAAGAMNVCQRLLSARIGSGLVFDMRTLAFRHIQRMPVAFFARAKAGALVSRLNNDVLGAQQAFTDILSSAVGNSITALTTVIAMFFISWKITLLSFLMVPVFVLPVRWIGRRLTAVTRELYDLSAQMNNVMIERFNVAGAMLVKLFGCEGSGIRLFERRVGQVRDVTIRQMLYSRALMTGLLLTGAVATALVYGWGGVEAAKGAFTVGSLVALSAYVTRLYAPLTALSNVQLDVLTALVSFDRVYEITRLMPSIADRPGAIAIGGGPATIEFDHVYFGYPGPDETSVGSLETVEGLRGGAAEPVLKDVSFTVEPGKLVALVGASGSGKTTIGQLVARLYDVSAGSVRIKGVDVRDATLASLESCVGVVTQDAHLFHESIRDNLLHGSPTATEPDLHDAMRAAQILHTVLSLPDGLDTIVGDRGYRLSGGEKQRLAIARLLLKQPDIVVLDEATAHLDSNCEALLQLSVIDALRSRTSLVIAHRLSTVRDADVILVLMAGRIVERGTHAELLAAGGYYAKLYDAQSGITPDEYSPKATDAVSAEDSSRGGLIASPASASLA